MYDGGVVFCVVCGCECVWVDYDCYGWYYVVVLFDLCDEFCGIVGELECVVYWYYVLLVCGIGGEEVLV